jgi:hypothetical protein
MGMDARWAGWLLPEMPSKQGDIWRLTGDDGRASFTDLHRVTTVRGPI